MWTIHLSDGWTCTCNDLETAAVNTLFGERVEPPLTDDEMLQGLSQAEEEHPGTLERWTRGRYIPF